jgi:predicted TIM-barrel enzyme
MREGASGVALALASGVTTANVGEYLPYVDAYLVGTGIERELGVLDPDETKRLAASIHAFAA